MMTLQKLQVGQRVHSILYGGRDGVIFKIHGDPQPQSIRQHVSGVVCMGGAADCDVVWENGTKSLRVPEAIIYGVQWRIHWSDIASQTVIDLMLANVERVTAIKEYDKGQEKLKFDAEKQKLLAKFPDLIREKDEKSPSCIVAAKNIRKLLKSQFPSTKFSVKTSRYSGGDSIRVEWVDGPTTEQVKKVTDPFTGSTFDGMQDLKSYVTTPFNSLFGDSDHIFADRDYSDSAIQSAIDEVFEKRGTKDGVKPTVEDFRQGRLWQVLDKWNNPNDYSQLIRKHLCDKELS
jgi:hypothetical protein